MGALTGVNCFETYQFCKKGGGGFEYRKLKVGKIELLHCEDLVTLWYKKNFQPKSYFFYFFFNNFSLSNHCMGYITIYIYQKSSYSLKFNHLKAKKITNHWIKVQNFRAINNPILRFGYILFLVLSWHLFEITC